MICDYLDYLNGYNAGKRDTCQSVQCHIESAIRSAGEELRPLEFGNAYKYLSDLHAIVEHKLERMVK